MTPGEVLVPGAIAIVFVVGWFVFGLIDATRRDSHREDSGSPGDGQLSRPVPQPVSHTARPHRR